MASSAMTSTAALTADVRKSQLGENFDDGNDEAAKSLRGGAPPQTPKGQMDQPGSSPIVPGTPVRRNILLLASEGLILRRRQPPSTPTREQKQRIPASAPLPSTAPITSTAPLPSRGGPITQPPLAEQNSQPSSGGVNHELTAEVLTLLQNQSVAPHIRQAIRQKINTFAFPMNGLRATINNLRERVKEKDEIITEKESELAEAKSKLSKTARAFEHKIELHDDYAQMTLRLRRELDEAGALAIKHAKKVKKLEERIVELEQKQAPPNEQEQMVDGEAGMMVEESEMEDAQDAIVAEEDTIEVKDAIVVKGDESEVNEEKGNELPVSDEEITGAIDDASAAGDEQMQPPQTSPPQTPAPQKPTSTGSGRVLRDRSSLRTPQGTPLKVAMATPTKRASSSKNTAKSKAPGKGKTKAATRVPTPDNGDDDSELSEPPESDEEEEEEEEEVDNEDLEDDDYVP